MLRHALVEMNMKIFKRSVLGDYPESSRRDTQESVKNCRSFQSNQGRKQRFLFSFCDPVIGQFNHTPQLDVMSLEHGNVLHVINVGKGFKAED